MYRFMFFTILADFLALKFWTSGPETLVIILSTAALETCYYRPNDYRPCLK